MNFHSRATAGAHGKKDDSLKGTRNKILYNFIHLICVTPSHMVLSRTMQYLLSYIRFTTVTPAHLSHQKLSILRKKSRRALSTTSSCKKFSLFITASCKKIENFRICMCVPLFVQTIQIWKYASLWQCAPTH